MTFFIAEISSNHNRDLERSLALIDAANSAGFDAVKFQLFEVEQLFAQEVLAASETHRARAAWELPQSFLEPLSTRARSLGMQFSVTPFSLSAVEQSQPFVDFFKVASYELLWDELFTSIAAIGKPVVFSTGMATIDEAKHACEVLRGAGCNDITALHCISAYPAPSEESNLAAIETLRNTLGVPSGWSDHTRREAVVQRAVNRWGAEVVELHFDLDSRGFEFGPGHCWLPEESSSLIQGIREGFRADGSGAKTPSPSELPDREWRADPSDGLRPLLHVRRSWDLTQ